MANDLLLLGAGHSGASTFDPASIPGLKLWLAADDGLVTDGAAQFTAANSEYLSIADNASFDFTSAFSVSFWMKLTTNGVAFRVVEKGVVGASFEYLFQIVGSNVGTFYVADALNDPGNNYVTTSATFSTGTWYHVTLVFDGSLTGNTNRAKVYINGVDVTTVGGGTIPSSLTPGSGTLQIGSGHSSVQPFDGALDSMGIWSRALSSSDVTALYNSGSGKVYSDLTAAEKVNLVSWWNLNELSGNRADSHGSNTLVDNATVTYAAGVASGTASADGDPISQWTDLSGQGNHATQATSTKRPTLKTAVKNGRNVLRGDGTDDFLALSSLSLGTAHTVFLVMKKPAGDGVALGSSGSVYAPYIDGTLIYYRPTGIGGVSVTHGLGAAAWGILAVRRSGTTVSFWKNGVQLGTNQTLSANNALSVTGVIGAGDGTFPCGSDFGEVAVYDSALSDGDLASWFGYGNGRWAVY